MEDNWEPEAANYDDGRPLPPPLAALAPPDNEWPEIDISLLEKMRGPVPVFPLDLLPGAWARWVRDTAASTGTAPDYVAQGVLAAVAAVCGAGVKIQVTPTWSESLVLWQALVGSPSSGKSPALAAVRRQLGAIEEELRERDVVRRGHHAASHEQAELVTARWKKDCAEAFNAGRDAPPRPADADFEEAFVPTQLVVADSTVEALADVVAGNPRGVVMWRDELTAWIANQGRYANGGSDRGQWLEAWSGASITINRRNRAAPLHLDHFPVSIVGTIQPDRIAEVFSGSDDGFAARFLYTWPDATPHVPLLQRPVADDDSAQAMLKRIAAVAGQPDAPLRLVFKPETTHAFDPFDRQVKEDAGAAEGLEEGWLGKGQGTVARLAGALALLAWSERDSPAPPDFVRLETLRDAMRLWNDYFRPHATSVFNQAGRVDRDRHARRVVRWLRLNAVKETSRETIRREALAHAVDAEGADRVIARLEAVGVLRAKPLQMTGKGRPSRRWAVNPALRE